MTRFTTTGRDFNFQPGDIILTRISGWAGVAVWLLQALNFDMSRWTHAAVVLDDGTVFEAQPGGAVITPIERYADRPVSVVRRWVLRDHSRPALTLTLEQRVKIVTQARGLVGVGYNWGTYVYLAMYRFYVRPKWVKRRVQRSDRLICSQAVDRIYTWAGVTLFDDGRMSCDVTPGDLARLL
jgi:hypothetical protein